MVSGTVNGDADKDFLESCTGDPGRLGCGDGAREVCLELVTEDDGVGIKSSSVTSPGAKECTSAKLGA